MSKDIATVDDAETVILEESRALNRALLTGWLEEKARTSAANFASRHKSVRKDIKKTPLAH